MIAMEALPIIHPHRLISYLFDQVGVNILDSDVVQFWRHAREHGQDFAVNTTSSDNHVPLGLYGDGAQLVTQYRKEKVVGLFLNLVLYRPRSVRCSRYLLFSCDEDTMVKNRTLNAVYRRLLWSFQALHTGYNPSTNPPGSYLSKADVERSGKPITADHRVFAVVEFRGDWAWHKLQWRFVKTGWQAIQVVCLNLVWLSFLCLFIVLHC